jgi:hypothetical protein
LGAARGGYRHIDSFAAQGPNFSIVEDFAGKVLAQRHIIAYGDQRAALTDLCRVLGIEVV